jgi:hypothetical protein
MYTYSGDAKLGTEHETYSPITCNVPCSQINYPTLFLVFSAVIKEETCHQPLHVCITIHLTHLRPLCPSTMSQRRSVFKPLRIRGNNYSTQRIGDFYKHVLCHSQCFIESCITKDLSALL